MDILFAYSAEVFEMVVLGKVSEGTVKPLAPLELLEGVRVGIGVVLDHWLDLPQLRPLDVWLIP